MAGELIANGKRFNFTATGACTKGGVFAITAGTFGGIYMKTGVTGDVVPVALEGTFKLATATTAAATKVFEVLDRVYAVISSKAITNATATATAVPIGINVGAATTSAAGAQNVFVKLTRFGQAA